MKVAITGATGFLGKYLVSYLLENLYDVLVIARRAGGGMLTCSGKRIYNGLFIRKFV